LNCSHLYNFTAKILKDLIIVIKKNKIITMHA
jgi:hypothetical protein